MNWWTSLHKLRMMTGIEIEVNLCRKRDWSWVCLTGIEMRSKLRMFVTNWDRSWVCSTGFEIEVGSLTGNEIEYLAFQLVNVVIKRYSVKSYYTYIYVNGIRKQNADSTYSLSFPLTICWFHIQFAVYVCRYLYIPSLSPESTFWKTLRFLNCLLLWAAAQKISSFYRNINKAMIFLFQWKVSFTMLSIFTWENC